MITQPITPGICSTGSVGAPAKKTTGFVDALDAVKTPTPKALEEEQALRELCRILEQLTLGFVDATVFRNPPDSTADMGPIRNEVERLKEVIRRLMCHQTRATPDIDPATGKPRQGDLATASLRALIDSLPADLVHLLRRAFPDLDQLLEQEAETLWAESQQGNATDLTAAPPFPVSRGSGTNASKHIVVETLLLF